MQIFDFVVWAVLLWGAIRGVQKGLIVGIARLAGKIGAIVVALLFYQPFLEKIENTFALREKLEPRIQDFLAGISSAQLQEKGLEAGGALVQPLVDHTTIVVTDYVLKIGAILVLFLLAVLAVNLILMLIVKPLARSLSLLNRGGGLLLGLLGSFIVIVLVVGAISPLFNVAETGWGGMQQSLMYPILLEAYDWLLAAIHMFDKDVLLDPLKDFLNQTSLGSQK